MFGYEVKNFHELNNDGSYSIVSLIEKDGKTYCVASSSYREMGAAPGSQWEIITDEDDYSPCIASNLVLAEESLFIPRYEYQKQELTFSSYKEMVSYWNANSVRVGDRNTGNGVEMVFALQGEATKLASGGYSLEPTRRLTPDSIGYVLSIARIQEGDRICRGLKNPYTVCCKPLATQNRSGYCKNHRHQSPAQKLVVKKARK